MKCYSGERTLFLFCSNTLRIWHLDLGNRKIRPIDVRMGQLKRTVKCIQVGDVIVFFKRSKKCIELEQRESLYFRKLYKRYGTASKLVLQGCY